MSLDISSYWQPAALTPAGLLQYWKDEIQLFATAQPSVDIEFGDAKALPMHAAGDVILPGEGGYVSTPPSGARSLRGALRGRAARNSH